MAIFSTVKTGHRIKITCPDKELHGAEIELDGQPMKAVKRVELDLIAGAISSVRLTLYPGEIEIDTRVGKAIIEQSLDNEEKNQ